MTASELAQGLLDRLASDGYAIEQLEDDARALAEAVLAETAEQADAPSIGTLGSWRDDA